MTAALRTRESGSCIAFRWAPSTGGLPRAIASSASRNAARAVASRSACRAVTRGVHRGLAVRFECAQRACRRDLDLGLVILENVRSGPGCPAVARQSRRLSASAAATRAAGSLAFSPSRLSMDEIAASADFRMAASWDSLASVRRSLQGQGGLGSEHAQKRQGRVAAVGIRAPGGFDQQRHDFPPGFRVRGIRVRVPEAVQQDVHGPRTDHHDRAFEHPPQQPRPTKPWNAIHHEKPNRFQQAYRPGSSLRSPTG